MNAVCRPHLSGKTQFRSFKWFYRSGIDNALKGALRLSKTMRINLSRTLLLAGTIQAAVFPSMMHAQIDRAEINGTITDITGAAIPGAQVVVTQEGTNQARTTSTNASGGYVASSLPVGRFTLMIHEAGFADYRVADIDLHADDVRTLNIHLQPSSVSQTVSVEADTGTVQLDKNDATFGGSIQAVQVQQLPLNGRNIATLELLAPGAIDNGSGQQATIRFAGQGIDDNNYRFDGVDAGGVLRQALKSGFAAAVLNRSCLRVQGRCRRLSCRHWRLSRWTGWPHLEKRDQQIAR
jgi:hypothetical protein